MKLKLDFVTKVPKEANDYEVILLKDKVIKNKIVKFVNKSLFDNKLFLEKKKKSESVIACLFPTFQSV